MRGTLACLSVLLAAAPAMAADLVSPDVPVIAAPDVAPERFGWTGAYIGATGGYGWLKDVDYAFNPALVSKGQDWIFGAHAGFLYQYGTFVGGVEGAYDRLNMQFEGLPVYAEDAYSLRLRGGFAYDKVLVTGHVGTSFVTTNIGLEDWALNIGGGVDYAVTDNVIVGAQYNHMRSDTYDDTLIYARIDTITGRVGFKF